MTKFLTGAALAALAVPSLAQDLPADPATTPEARSGVRVELRATYETPTTDSLDDDEVYKLGSAVAFGGEAGFDIRLGDRFVAGPYGQYERSSLENCDEGFCVRPTDYLEAGLHLGYATGGNGQVYGKIGYGQLGFETEGLGLDSKEEGKGLALSLGYEFGLGETLYGRLEGGFTNLGEVYGLDFQRRHAGVALGARF